jgi:molybdopterin synthase sulfur carrier subunit
MSEIRIPPTLRSATSGAKLVQVEGESVRELVSGLVAAYPELSSRLLDPAGEINAFVNVFLNGTDVRHLDGLDTRVQGRDSLVLLPAMAGG